ncbi:MAG: hypothetical protein FWD49_06780, partial [Firmicutes bacterium]|nr:hypothetical protein [Bacillota bacterium]
SHEISRLKTALDDAVLGVFSLNMHIKNVPYSLSGIVNVNIPPSSLNVKKGDLITVFVDNVNLVQADLNAQYAFFKGYANMANATCFSLNLSVQDSQESPIALSGSADIKVQIPHTFNKKRYKPVKAEIYFRSAPTAVPVKLTSNLSQENDAWFISASTDSFGDFYILAEYEEIINPKGVIIRGRFYPWALLGWVIGAVGGVIAVSVALVLIISKRKVNKRGN